MSRLPLMARALLPRELVSWSLAAVAVGAVEGGVMGVLVKNLYAHAADEVLVNLAVAVVSGAPMFANMLSFSVAAFSQGRNRIRILTALLLLLALCVGLIALAPDSANGLILVVLGTVGARIAWAGAVTLRAAIWRANFQRAYRARVAGRVTVATSMLIAVTGIVIGLALDWRPGLVPWLFLAAAAFGLAAARVVHRYGRLRGQRRLLRQEGPQATVRAGLAVQFRILRDDRRFRQYMAAMFVFGGGNLMVLAPLVIILNEQFEFSRLGQVLVTSSLPLLALAFAVPFWARLLDGMHILDYRARQSWVHVAALLLFALAAALGLPELFWVAGVMKGIAFAGGVLGWNLGHNDFSSDAHSGHYMGLHVTLTGIRGLLMPVAGVLLYQVLEAWQPGLGRYALVPPFLLALAGAVWFVLMARANRRGLPAA